MELINYLNKHFFTRQQLLAAAKVSEDDLAEYQAIKLMPQCSYRLKLNSSCESFFGLHSEAVEIEYYAKGYVSWLAVIQSLRSAEQVYAVFGQRYKAAITQLNALGHTCADPKVNAAIDLHIKDEWQHFIKGSYGLCTKSGLPEDIAAKEVAILEINALASMGELDPGQLTRMRAAVNLLDRASSLFAPHERLRSSRHRLVDEVRHKFGLAG